MRKLNTVAALVIALFAIGGCTKQAESPDVKTESDNTPAVESEEVVVYEEISILPAVAKNKMQKKRALSPKKIEVISYDSSFSVIPMERRDNYLNSESNGVQQVMNNPLSTFSIDVDTGSYANVRSFLNMGEVPPTDAIREEAFINYFPYNYEQPLTREIPFKVQTDMAPAPWNTDRQLLRVALQGYDIPESERKPSNLVFLIDVSGSMGQANKLPLLKSSLKMLTKALTKQDTISLVTYASGSSVVLESTSGDKQQTILNALDNLTAGGGTAGEGGIKLAYQQADIGYIENGVNRILLATDGDFNIGVSDIDQLKQLIKKERERGISLTTLGFGRGNYNDGLMEQLANVGNGNHAYIDTLHEANKVLLRQMSGTLQTIASDVKIQVEFNPETVKEYRLIGYQNRQLKHEEFNNDKVDAGEIGAGHAVTALYELTFTGKPGQIDALRYQKQAQSEKTHADEIAQIKVRYKLPEEKASKLTTHLIHAQDSIERFELADEDFQFAASVAAFAQKLKDNSYMNNYSYKQIAEVARRNVGSDPYHYRGEFVSLVEIAQKL